MNLRQLQTLAHFVEHRSFAAVGDVMKMSHSAISVQMQQLEEALGTKLFDRAHRPPVLTADGVHIARISQQVVDLCERMHQIAEARNATDSLALGFVPTTLQHTLPFVLQRMKRDFPALDVSVTSGLSQELAEAVVRRDLDFALLTSPVREVPELLVSEVAIEPLYAVGPKSLDGLKDDAMLTGDLPFIAFSRSSWLGQQIAAELQSRGLTVPHKMEVDSLDAIEALVTQGYGVSVIPQRIRAPELSERMACRPFGSPTQSRKLVLIQHVHGRQSHVEQGFRDIIHALADET